MTKQTKFGTAAAAAALSLFAMTGLARAAIAPGDVAPNVEPISHDGDIVIAMRGGGGGGLGGRGGGGGGFGGRGGGGGFNGGGRDVRASANSNVNFNGNRSFNRNTNINVNRNVNVNNNIRGACYGGCYYHGWDNYHPVARAAAWGAAAAITAAAVGSVAYSVPPTCVTTVIGDVSYYQCGNTWYQPRYAGTNVEYVVVTSPR
jgi:hypothetical protein